jgi:multiple sugar transport system substrate-binding protein
MLLAVTVAMCGCAAPDPSDDDSPPSLTGVTLRVLVVDDPPLAEAIGWMRGEWNAQTDGQLVVQQTTADNLLATESIDGDVVIYRSALLGELAERGSLAPVNKAALDSFGYDAGDVFPLVQRCVSVWGEETETTYAVPLGSPVLVLMYRKDLFTERGLQPPETWQEYQQLVIQLAAKPPADRPDWSPTLEPLADRWRATMLLARAAAYAKTRDNYSTLFRLKTMRPLIDGPPFVRALGELAATASVNKAKGDPVTPQGAFQALLDGRSAMAIGWPSGAEGTLPGHAAQSRAHCGFAELPGSRDVYDVGEAKWISQKTPDDLRATLLATSGRLGCVVKSSKHPQAGARLLAWLSLGDQKDRSASIPSTHSNSTTLFRHTQVSAARRWVDPQLDRTAASQYARAVRASLRRKRYLTVVRLPGSDRYMTALDVSVAEVLAGRQTPHEALQKAASQWQAITDELGVDGQRRAYERSLGLEP